MKSEPLAPIPDSLVSMPLERMTATGIIVIAVIGVSLWFAYKVVDRLAPRRRHPKDGTDD